MGQLTHRLVILDWTLVWSHPISWCHTNPTNCHTTYILEHWWPSSPNTSLHDQGFINHVCKSDIVCLLKAFRGTLWNDRLYFPCTTTIVSWQQHVNSLFRGVCHLYDIQRQNCVISFINKQQNDHINFVLSHGCKHTLTLKGTLHAVV